MSGDRSQITSHTPPISGRTGGVPVRNERDLIQRRDVQTGRGVYTLSIEKEDLSHLYPGMERYSLFLISEGNILSVFRTNTYEYSPQVHLDARMAVLRKADYWECQLKSSPPDFLEALLTPRTRCVPPLPATDLVVIQGSPRPDGNCSVLAGWAVEAARSLGKTSRVLYPDDMEIRPCIGCYQCYNTGHCTYDDDMSGIIGAIKGASLLVICSPVYTNTVPGGLKLCIDRCMAYHAEISLTGRKRLIHGQTISVCGRTGLSNFGCLLDVVETFMKNLGIRPAEPVLIDGMDQVSDIRKLTVERERVVEGVRACLGRPTITRPAP